MNPLKSRFQIPAAAPIWEEVYAKPFLPLVLDIGCAAGRFLLEMAETLPGHNFLGLDIREPVTTCKPDPVQEDYSLLISPRKVVCFEDTSAAYTCKFLYVL